MEVYGNESAIDRFRRRLRPDPVVVRRDGPTVQIIVLVFVTKL